MSKREAVGCLLIDDARSGGNALSGLLLSRQIRSYPFEWGGEGHPLAALQALLHTARLECASAAILARGAGCGAALALAEQLPVDRLALIDPAPALTAFSRGRLDARVRRLNAFARRNLSLCVADALVIEGERSRGYARLLRGGCCARGRLTRLVCSGNIEKELYTICENTLKSAITHFLRTGEPPKNLAENAEMCIIYG